VQEENRGNYASHTWPSLINRAACSRYRDTPIYSMSGWWEGIMLLCCPVEIYITWVGSVPEIEICFSPTESIAL
jgi:hypothetical protein